MQKKADSLIYAQRTFRIGMYFIALLALALCIGMLSLNSNRNSSEVINQIKTYNIEKSLEEMNNNLQTIHGDLTKVINSQEKY